MRRLRNQLLGLALGILIGCGGVAVAQQYASWALPTGATSNTAVIACVVNGSTTNAQPCGNTAVPVVISGAVTTATHAVTQSGTWRFSNSVGVWTKSAVTSLGTTSTQVFAANAARNAIEIQNPAKGIAGAANTNDVWCDDTGAAAVAGPGSVYIPPGTTWQPGGIYGFASSAIVNCIASAAATPLSARQN